MGRHSKKPNKPSTGITSKRRAAKEWFQLSNRRADTPGPSFRKNSPTSTNEGASAFSPWRKVLAGFLIFFAALTAFATAMMWPSSDEPNVKPEFYSVFGLGQAQVDAEVLTEFSGACHSEFSGTTFTETPRISPAEPKDCTWFITTITSGDDAGANTLLINSGQPGEPDLAVGDEIRLIASPAADGGVQYAFGDYQRSGTLAAWMIALGLGIVAFAWWRGIRAILGLLVTFFIVATFILPALLHGQSPLMVAAVGGSLILFLVLFMVHGFNWKSASALGGTLIALAFAAWLAHVAIDSNHLRGLGDDDNLHVFLYLPDVSVTGLMLCGFIVGALGVLNDVAISQSSTVNELSELDPQATPWRLFLGAMDVGRDHISSMVYTLVLTYTGASLPLLLLLSVSERPLLQTLSSDIVSTELLRSGIGALALTLAVPITTLIAAWTVPNRHNRKVAEYQEALSDAS